MELVQNVPFFTIMLSMFSGTLSSVLPGKFARRLNALMLAAVTRYAVGLVYDAGVDPEREILLLKKMLLREYVTETK